MEKLQMILQKARPYLPGLPEEVSLLPWEAVEHEEKGKRGMALHRAPPPGREVVFSSPKDLAAYPREREWQKCTGFSTSGRSCV